MSSDTDTSASSSTSEETRRHKIHKKLKKKSEKKHKKQKKEKRSKKKKRSRELELDEMRSVPIMIPPITRNSSENVAVLDDVFGPALPPHLLQKQQQHLPAQNAVTEERNIVGPILPQQGIPMETQEKLKDEDDDDNDDDDYFSYGPMPINLAESGEQHMSEQQIKLEQRALELKLAAIEGNTLTNVDQKLREEWMLELPDVGLKSGLAAIANMKRTFHQGKEKPDFSDRSEWTKTPNSGTDSTTKPGTSKAATEKLINNAQTLYERQRDEEQELLAKKFKKKHKREESLVEIHQKKLRKEQKQKVRILL
ncbi:GPALPP motifs-containing protein 1-like [Teleopsis dalmanni]|uniref:GPALPP motifs-containing protein 1-like n=1 Tax=Teleopsis dalmanni TaxID=139649 RepID=UPI0018CD4B45|nr:GPALPP motifs-containing protein 1-like [Teleopsis dalmanni]